MTRIGTHLAAIEAWLLALQYEGKPLVTECRRQLDLVDAEDVEKQSFRSPAGFLVLPRLRLAPRTDGGRDAQLWIVIAIAARGTSSKPMDIDVIDRAIVLAAALDDQDFGQTDCTATADIEARPVLQASLETKGLAVAAVSFQQMLFRVVPASPATTGLLGAFGAGGPPPGSPTNFEGLLGDGLTSEERAAVGGWS
jgi:hypothetical protein